MGRTPFSQSDPQSTAIQYEGRTLLDVDIIAPEHGCSHQAVEALAQIETLAQASPIPDRFRIEIVNQQALAAIRDGDQDHFCHYFLEGLQGANALASEKRRQEAIANWKATRERWPQENQILKLADLFMA